MTFIHHLVYLIDKNGKSDLFTTICTQLTFDLILGLGGIFRLGIHPYPTSNTSRYTMSMDAKMYSKMPTEFFLRLWMANYNAILKDGIVGNIEFHVKLYEIWTNGSGGDVV